jgi:hypothetical protein
MRKPNMTLSKKLATAASIAALLTVGLIADRAVAQAPPPPPPPEYVATTEPVYYEGHAAYWYNNRWHYRDERGVWRFYDHEPQALQDRRMHAPPARRDYGHGHGRR